MKIASFGKYGLHTIQYPSGRFGYVGTVPEILCIEKKPVNKLPYTVSMSFDTEEEAIMHFESVKHLIN